MATTIETYYGVKFHWCCWGIHLQYMAWYSW